MYRDRTGNLHKKPENVVAKPRESAYGIFVLDHKILLVKPVWIDRWELPGGGRDEGEELIQTLQREFLEETGYTILDFERDPVHLVTTKFYAEDIDAYFDSKMYYYEIKAVGEQNAALIQTHEIADVAYVLPAQLNEQNTNQLQMNIILEAGMVGK